MVGFILLVIVFFTVRYIVRLRNRVRNLEMGTGGKKYINMEESLKIERKRASETVWNESRKAMEIEKKYKTLQTTYDTDTKQLESYKTINNNLRERVKDIQEYKDQIRLHDNQIRILKENHQKELEQYNQRFFDENSDLIQELGLKLAREKAKERLTEMERKYNAIINDMELDYKRQLLNLEQRFAQNQQQEIERLATLKAKAYLQDNFPLQ